MGDSGFIEVTVWRSDPDARRKFRVPRRESQTVLDVVSWIQAYEDPGLAYRYACRVGMCGSCAMMVGGVPRWTCRTHVSRVEKRGRLEIAPLRNLPVVRDLVTDMAPFFDKWTKAQARHHPTATRNDPVVAVDPASPGRERANAGIECINCAVCYAACDTVAGNPDYLGPAALNRAWTVVNDVKDGARGAVLDAVAEGGGCLNCHSMGSCTAYCPNGLDPLSSIAGLKRALVARSLGRDA